MTALVQSDFVGYNQLDIVQQENKNIRTELTNIRRGLFRRYDDFTSEIKAENETLRATGEILKTEIDLLKTELMMLKQELLAANALGEKLQILPEPKKQCQVYFI